MFKDTFVAPNKTMKRFCLSLKQQQKESAHDIVQVKFFMCQDEAENL